MHTDCNAVYMASCATHANTHQYMCGVLCVSPSGNVSHLYYM